jgi:hypothetical protein
MMAGGGPTPGRAVRMHVRDAAAVVRVRRFGVDPFGSQKYSAAAAADLRLGLCLSDGAALDWARRTGQVWVAI